ncbi:malonyl-ACP O-methyltransferase BioC [Marinobacter sp. M216]|uniref:Malonyl-[acyl-carrier protein] O-methyltransferase n=1 Tax=Marinobacter albus TaxID=3030833 RepID=A0ABT7H9Y5_9GAMM|nr:MULTISPECIES: malonyl-ACP O-methyltransferase BioC [unclassified Marinobacter]MBW7470571.1 malonyl-ACP O-methyltransferase BioC [Marinobacter sp. F4218]MDK9557161.1 malonyl-ACP O-methyltransferase BioC [Marinobacter sp. M216]
MTAAACLHAEATEPYAPPEKEIAEKSLISKQFGNACATYENASRLQRRMGEVMCHKLESGENSLRPLRVLDLGCGTGWFARRLSQMWPSARVTGVDLSPAMIRRASEQSDADIDWLVADAEALPLPDCSFDVVFSNLMIQWCADPGPVFAQCRRLLRPGGRLMVSTLLDGTLRELVGAWASADPGRPHVNRFETESFLQARVAGELPGASVETRTLQLPYASPVALAAELKQLGAGFKSEGRRKTLTAPGRVRAMCRQYPREADGTVIASYEAAWVDWGSAD